MSGRKSARIATSRHRPAHLGAYVVAGPGVAAVAGAENPRKAGVQEKEEKSIPPTRTECAFAQRYRNLLPRFKLVFLDLFRNSGQFLPDVETTIFNHFRTIRPCDRRGGRKLLERWVLEELKGYFSDLDDDERLEVNEDQPEERKAPEEEDPGWPRDEAQDEESDDLPLQEDGDRHQPQYVEIEVPSNAGDMDVYIIQHQPHCCPQYTINGQGNDIQCCSCLWQ